MDESARVPVGCALDDVDFARVDLPKAVVQCRHFQGPDIAVQSGATNSVEGQEIIARLEYNQDSHSPDLHMAIPESITNSRIPLLGGAPLPHYPITVPSRLSLCASGRGSLNTKWLRYDSNHLVLSKI